LVCGYKISPLTLCYIYVKTDQTSSSVCVWPHSSPIRPTVCWSQRWFRLRVVWVGAQAFICQRHVWPSLICCHAESFLCTDYRWSVVDLRQWESCGSALQETLELRTSIILTCRTADLHHIDTDTCITATVWAAYLRYTDNDSCGSASQMHGTLRISVTGDPEEREQEGKGEKRRGRGGKGEGQDWGEGKGRRGRVKEMKGEEKQNFCLSSHMLRSL